MPRNGLDRWQAHSAMPSFILASPSWTFPIFVSPMPFIVGRFGERPARPSGFGATAALRAPCEGVDVLLLDLQVQPAALVDLFITCPLLRWRLQKLAITSAQGVVGYKLDWS